MEEYIWKDTNIFYNVLCFLITENEKLFDRSDSKLYWTTVYHMFGVLHNVYITIFAGTLDIKPSPNVELDNLYRYKPGYLTGWNFMFQTVFLTMSLVYDIMEWFDRHESPLGRKLKYFRDILFEGLVVPLTLFITSMFWTVYWIDRELVFPQVYDQLVPWWFNHCVHTNIAIVVLVETVLLARRHPTNFKLELWLVGGAGVLYAIVYYSIYFFAHRWLYGVFGIMTWWQVCLYQILIWSSTFAFYFIQFPVNRLFHREEPTDQKEVQETKTGIQNGAYCEESSGIPQSWMKDRSKNQISMEKMDKKLHGHSNFKINRIFKLMLLACVIALLGKASLHDFQILRYRDKINTMWTSDKARRQPSRPRRRWRDELDKTNDQWIYNMRELMDATESAKVVAQFWADTI